MEQCISRISRSLPCREEQLSELYSLIGEPDEPFPPGILVNGNTSTGKSACVSALLDYFKYKSAIVNCVECYTPQILFENVLDQISGHEMSEDSNFEAAFKCDSLKDFFTNLNDIFSDSYDPVVLVFDKAERLFKIDANLFAAFMKIREYCAFNVTCVFIACTNYEDFDFKVSCREPFTVHFPQYSKRELYDIVFLQKTQCNNEILRRYELDETVKQKISKSEFFGNYLNALLSVYSRVCVDLCELRYMARVHYPKYCDPVLTGAVKADDVAKLWKNIAPILKMSLNNLYLRIDESTSDTNAVINELTSTKAFAHSFELPYYGKFLLVAAYLSSYNPEKEDKRLFMKDHGKQRKRMQQVNAKNKISDKLNTQLGPKPFHLDRLLAIFYAILDDKTGLTCNLFSQIQTFVELGLLSATKDGETDRKYKCNVGYDFVMAVAETIGFNLRKYLYDFY